MKSKQTATKHKQMDITLVQIITTPFRRFMCLDMYDSMLCKSLPTPLYTRCDREGSYRYFNVFKYDDAMLKTFEADCAAAKLMIRFEYVNYPRFHDDDWRKTNGFKEVERA